MTGMKSYSLIPLLVLVRLFNPLQGMLNILVFTRPHVAKERTKNPSLSWWGAFKKVVASGGDDDDERTNRLRRGVMAAAASARSAANNSWFARCTSFCNNKIQLAGNGQQTKYKWAAGAAE